MKNLNLIYQKGLAQCITLVFALPLLSHYQYQ